MASGEAGGGKKRKASSVAEDVALPARREPRRGVGVAELERIRVALEVNERCYAAASFLSTPHQPPPPALHPAALVMHAARVAAVPEAHHQHVGNGAVHQLQMTRGYLTPYYFAQHYYGNDSLTRLALNDRSLVVRVSRRFTTNGGQPSFHQNHHSSHQNHYRQADQIQSAVTAHPVPITGQVASSESSSSASQQQQGRRREDAKPGQKTALPQVAFVDLVDSDDDNGGDVEELNLELKL